MVRRKTKTISALCTISLVLAVSSASAMQAWQNKRRFVDPPRGNEISFVSDGKNKVRAADWVNSNDASYIRMRSEIDRRFPLWAHGRAMNIAPGSIAISPGRFVGELNISYTNNLAGGQKYNNTIQAQIVDGDLCFGDATAFYKLCDDVPSSQAEADSLYAVSVARNAQNQQEVERAKRETALVIAGSRTRRPGSPLNDEDNACMKTFSEKYQEYAEGQCARGYNTTLDNGTPGPYVCTAHDGGMVTRTRDYEKNICNRSISFRDQCGSTIFGSYTVRPGARFDRKFGYPCGRVY